jgi:hypothetical protein
VGENVYFLHIAVFGKILEQRLQGVARIVGALTVISVSQQAAARRPSHENGRAVNFGVVNDLRETVDRVFEAIVEAVDEDENTAVRASFDGRLQPAFCAIEVELLSLQGGKVGCRIGRQLLRPGNIAFLASLGQRDCDLGERRRPSPLAREHFAGDSGLRPSGRDQHVNAAGIRDCVRDGCQHVLGMAAAADGQDEDKTQEHTLQMTSSRHIQNGHGIPYTVPTSMTVGGVSICIL